ncbi:MAG: hypothetical protein V4631_22050 [Pseudomonadota bacterium]
MIRPLDIEAERRALSTFIATHQVSQNWPKPLEPLDYWLAAKRDIASQGPEGLREQAAYGALTYIAAYDPDDIEKYKHNRMMGWTRTVIERARRGVEASRHAAAELVASQAASERITHDFPALQAFHAKHALGPMLPPSCLCCGQQTHPYTRPVAIKHGELPGIVICVECRDASQAAPVAPSSIPAEMPLCPTGSSEYQMGRADGWNQCRSAYLHGKAPVQAGELPPLPPHPEPRMDWTAAERAAIEAHCAKLHVLAEQYSDMLRKICFEYGAGGYNSEGLMPVNVAEDKVRWIIEDTRIAALASTSAQQADVPKPKDRLP